MRKLTGSLLLILSAVSFGSMSCRTEAPEPDFVARVYGSLLTKDEVAFTLESLGPGLDSAEAARRYVEGWVTGELLFEEATRRGLSNDADVRRRMAESERSVLISALLDQVYRDEESVPSGAEVQTYFESHRESLALLEPYLRVRYLSISDPDSAADARRMLVDIDTSDVGGWRQLLDRFSDDPNGSYDLSLSYVPQGRLFTDFPLVRNAVRALRAGQTSTVIDEFGTRHLIQLLDRVPAGTVPRLGWIEETLRQRLEIENRKQLYARLVQDLRNEALVREVLEVR